MRQTGSAEPVFLFSGTFKSFFYSSLIMDEKWFVLVNPAAGGYKAEKAWPHISEGLKKENIDFQFQFSRSATDILKVIGDALQQGFRKFIAVGGDGTLNLMINGLFQHSAIQTNTLTIAIIPVGTGNDWIRTQRIPKSHGRAILLIGQGNTFFHDVGKICLHRNDSVFTKYFINIAGFGFQGLVAERIEGVSSGIKKGIFAFVLGIFDALFRYDVTRVWIKMDEKKLEGLIYNVNTGICKFCGGGMKMTPDAITDDGLFDITIVKKISRAEVILNIPGLFNGRFLKNKKVSQYRARKISIVSTPLMPVECDGEVLGYGNAEVEILEKAIRVIGPSGDAKK
ncbi:MAG TPA: diacylglycerol kinase family lipid kinase [Chitinophagales bacterium]|nr:diacylglycerol kinase family lipid kinase [Chitinophagales bacterium]